MFCLRLGKHLSNLYIALTLKEHYKHNAFYSLFSLLFPVSSHSDFLPFQSMPRETQYSQLPSPCVVVLDHKPSHDLQISNKKLTLLGLLRKQRIPCWCTPAELRLLLSPFSPTYLLQLRSPDHHSDFPNDGLPQTTTSSLPVMSSLELICLRSRLTHVMNRKCEQRSLKTS